MSGLTTTSMTAGSIEGAGSYILGAKILTVGSNDLSTTVSGVISGPGGSLTKVGTGTLTLTNIETYTGATTVKAARWWSTARLRVRPLQSTGRNAVWHRHRRQHRVFSPAERSPRVRSTVSERSLWPAGSLSLRRRPT